MTVRALPLPCSVADHLAIAEQQLAPGLVAREAWKRLRAIADPLPVAAEEAALEVRLEAGNPRVDFSLCLRASGRGRERLMASARPLPQEGSPGWRRAFAFLHAWTSTASALHDNVRALWLEFDTEGPGTPEPFVVFTIDGERLYAGGSAEIDALVETVSMGIDRLAEGAFDPLATLAVERCLRGLPPFAQIRHAAVRPTPSGDVARLVVRMPWRRLAATLVGLGWPGDAAELGATLERLCPHTPVHPVNLDVTRDGLGPRVGIEFVHLGAPGESARWQELLDVLESSGACARERRDAIAGWGGELFGPAFGPGILSVRRDLLIKVVYQTGAPLRAKAYLAFAPRLRVDEPHEEVPSVPAGSSSGRAPSL